MDKEGRSHRRHSSRERSVSRSYSRRSPSSHSYSRSDRRSSDRSRRRESSSDRRSHRHSSHNDRDRSSSRYRDRRRDESRRRERDVSQSRSRRREERSESVEPNQGKITINKTFKGFKLQKPVTTGGLKRPSVFNVDSKKSQTASKSVFLPFKNSKNDDLETKEQSSVFEVNSTPTTTKEEEVEDLDALMAHYADEAQKDLQAIHEEKNEQQQETEQVASDHNVISFEDFLKGNEEDQEDHEEEDNDDLKQFMSDIAKKQEEEFQAQNRKEQEQKQASAIGYNDSDNDMDVMDEELNESELTILDHSQRRMQKKQLAPVDHSKIDYLPIKKDFFILPSAVKAMTEKEIEVQRRNWNMRVKGNDCPPPIFTWDQTYLNDKILYTLKKNNYEQPFPIQCQSIPAVMKGRDVIAIARTGSGKTLAYLLPMFKHILSQPPLREGEGPIAIIMAPARELVTQIYKEAQKFTSLLNMKIVAVYGGSSVGEQINSLKKGCDIVVCTPGRMIDLLCLNSGRLISFTRISFVVLDEADRMLDDGFEPQINMILNNIRPDRQMVMFSATFPPRVEQLARDKIQMPLIIMVGGRAEVAGEVDQHVEVINKEDKWFRLLQILGEWESKGSILIFVDKQEKCDQLLAELNKCGHYALVLHGSMDQIDREQSISDFKNGLRHIMIATSVAGRGLDVRDLKLVINFDCPNHLEDYVHRVGRTGRAGDLGTSYTFITPEEQQYAPDLVKALRTSKLDVPDDLRSLADDYERKIRAGEAKRHMDQYRCTNGYTFSEQEEAKNEYDKKQQSLKADMDAGLISTEAALAEQKQDEELLAQYNVDVGHASSRTTESIITTIKKPKPVDFGGNRERKDALAVLQKLDLIKIPERMITQVVNGENIYLWKVPINDYPSKVRVRIMSRTELNCISEATDTSLTVRGEYIPNMTQMLGREPLHIAVESKSEYCVHAGVKMLKNTINEITQELGYNDLPTTGRFTVV